MYREHLNFDLPGLLGEDEWKHLKRVAAMRHVLVRNAGIVDDRFLDRLPDWPQQAGQRVQVKQQDAAAFVVVLEHAAQVLIETAPA